VYETERQKKKRGGEVKVARHIWKHRGERCPGTTQKKKKKRFQVKNGYGFWNRGKKGGFGSHRYIRKALRHGIKELWEKRGKLKVRTIINDPVEAATGCAKTRTNKQKKKNRLGPLGTSGEKGWARKKRG